MKVLFLGLMFIIMHIPSRTQTLPEWQRVYTFDESFIELNTNYVMFSNNKTERVRFRWTFNTPQGLSQKPELQYQSILEEIAFDCRNDKFRVYNIQWYDAKGKLLLTESRKSSEEWQGVDGGMLWKLFAPACKLIEFRKRKPPLQQ